jgi:co-chaperonin GroES (HSP10)
LIAVEPDVVDARLMIKLPDWQRNLQGTVLAVGPGLPLADGGEAPMMCKVGDRVLFGAAAGMEAAYKGALIRILHDSDVDAVL